VSHIHTLTHAVKFRQTDEGHCLSEALNLGLEMLSDRALSYMDHKKRYFTCLEALIDKCSNSVILMGILKTVHRWIKGVNLYSPGLNPLNTKVRVCVRGWCRCASA
jgi:hypothetical protein